MKHPGFRLRRGYITDWTQDGKAPSTNKDLSTPAEIRLGELIKEKYHTDYHSTPC